MRKEEKTFPLFLLPPFLLFTLKFTGDDCSSSNNKRLLFSSFPRKQSFQAAIYSEKVEELGHRNSSVVADNQTAEIDLIRWLVSIQSVSLSAYPSYKWWAEIEQSQQANNPLSTLSLLLSLRLHACLLTFLLRLKLTVRLFLPPCQISVPPPMLQYVLLYQFSSSCSECVWCVLTYHR